MPLLLNARLVTIARLEPLQIKYYVHQEAIVLLGRLVRICALQALSVPIQQRSQVARLLNTVPQDLLHHRNAQLVPFARM